MKPKQCNPACDTATHLQLEERIILAPRSNDSANDENFEGGAAMYELAALRQQTFWSRHLHNKVMGGFAKIARGLMVVIALALTVSPAASARCECDRNSYGILQGRYVPPRTVCGADQVQITIAPFD